MQIAPATGGEIPTSDLHGARQAGYSWKQIATEMAQKRHFDVAGAHAAGYSYEAIARWLWLPKPVGDVVSRLMPGAWVRMSGGRIIVSLNPNIASFRRLKLDFRPGDDPDKLEAAVYAAELSLLSSAYHRDIPALEGRVSRVESEGLDRDTYLGKLTQRVKTLEAEVDQLQKTVDVLIMNADMDVDDPMNSTIKRR